MTNLTDIKDMSPNDRLVKQLEDALEEAKKGKLRSIVWAQQWHDTNVTNGWSLDGRSSSRLMLAGLIMLQHEFTVNIEITERGSVLCDALGIEE